jgi:hypothetical protein
MRIVITKNGKMMIREINPEIRYKSLTTTHNPLANKIFRNRSKKNHSRNNSFGSTTNNISSVHHSNLEIEDVLSNVKSNKKNLKTSTECKILDIDPNKNLSLPQSIAERYFTDHNTLENEDKNLLPDVFVSINKSIEHDANTKGFNYIYNNISSLQTMREREMGASLSPKKTIEDNSSSLMLNSEKKEATSYVSSFSLPKILPAYPLKYIINPYSIRNIKKEVKIKEYELKKGKRLTEDHFRSEVIPNPRYNLELSLKNEIKTENTNLITYLNKSKDIKVPFVERLSTYDNDQIKRLNKISQKTMFIKGQEKVIRDKIQNKIKEQYRLSSEEYKEGLETLKEKLHRYEDIVKIEEKKKIDKRERYLQKYSEAEKYWVKSNALRFYKKSDPPKNSATGLVIEK